MTACKVAEKTNTFTRVPLSDHFCHQSVKSYVSGLPMLPLVCCANGVSIGFGWHDGMYFVMSAARLPCYTLSMLITLHRV